MNVFHIPSWYPSQDHPLAGIFIKEQIYALAAAYPQHHFAISLWGQREEAKLLWAKEPMKSISKLFAFQGAISTQSNPLPNLTAFYYPALTWTNKLFSGNLPKIIKANEHNLISFERVAQSVDLIHAHVSFPAGYIAFQIAKKYKLPYLITEHMSPFPLKDYTQGGKIKSEITTAMAHASTVVAVSPAAAQDIQRKMGILPQVIPNWVDEQLFNLAPKPAPNKAFTFFSLGRMVPQKGFPDLLKAISKMRHQHAIFRIAGKGANEKEYQVLAEQLGLGNRIQWLGALSRKEVAKEMHACHAFVLASLHESMGVVFAEALACGKPIIATRCGGPEFLVNEYNGMLVPPQDSASLALAMDNMLDQYAQYQPEQIRSEYLAQYSSAQILSKIEVLYLQAIQNRKIQETANA